MDPRDCRDTSYADESKYLILKLGLDSSLSACAVSHKSLYDEGCERFFRWLSTGIQESSKLVESRGLESSNSAQRGDLNQVWNAVPEESQLPSSHYPRSLDSLELSDVHMGNAGFQALVHWLESIRARGNPKFHLTKLRLRFNEIEGTSELAKAFVSALSFSSPSKNQPSSSLSSLILSNNPLSPDFKRTLFELLPQIQSLSNLHLTMTGLTTVDALALASYIAQPQRRCKLVELHANSNNMGHRGVRAIIKAMHHCWTMEKVEMYANDTESDLAVGNEDDEESEEEWAAVDVDDHLITSREAITSFSIGSGCGWAVLQQKMKLTLARNVFLKRETEREALRLLKYSRLMLHPNTSITTLKPSSRSYGDCDCVQPEDAPALVAPFASSIQNFSASNFSWLPTELQLSILAHLAPLLTPAQRIRIFEFAVDRSTLPSLRLCLPSANRAASPSVSKHCVPDPENLSFNQSPPSSGRGKRMGSLRTQNAGAGSSFSTPRNIHACGSGTCMGNRSVLCKRKTDRQKWLELVGCDFYDPDSSTI